MELRFVSGYVFHTVIDRRKLEFLLELYHVLLILYGRFITLIVECVPFPNRQYEYKNMYGSHMHIYCDVCRDYRKLTIRSDSTSLL